MEKNMKKKNEEKEPKKPVTINILSNEEWNLTLNACKHSKTPLENELILRLMKDLGLRIGEAAHIIKEWVDFNKKTIRIPPHQPCSCYYCIVQYKQRMKHMGPLKNISAKEVEKWQWQPKSKAGARTIYYGYNREAKKVINDFFTTHDKWPYLVGTTGKRVGQLFKIAGLKGHVPHDLRKTAGTFWAHKLTLFELMDIMGWDDINVAKRYIRFAGFANVKVMIEKFGETADKTFTMESSIVFYITSLGRWAITRKKKNDESEWLRNKLMPKNDPQKRLY